MGENHNISEQKGNDRSMPLPKKASYTTEDIESLPVDVYAELIEGEILFMEAPTRTHQYISMSFGNAIFRHIGETGADCEVYAAPFGVYIKGFENHRNFLLPDLLVICDREKLHEKGIDGAPDWVIEIVSPSTRGRDFKEKEILYQSSGVRLYWIIDPYKKMVIVYDFTASPEDFGSDTTGIYSFDSEITVAICKDFRVQMNDFIPVEQS